MTDRFHSLIVVLDKDVRDDDAEPLMAAIAQMRGVAAVTGIVADVESHMAETRARLAMRGRLLDLARDL